MAIKAVCVGLCAGQLHVFFVIHLVSHKRRFIDNGQQEVKAREICVDLDRVSGTDNTGTPTRTYQPVRKIPPQVFRIQPLRGQVAHALCRKRGTDR